jgi:hypothetical protein
VELRIYTQSEWYDALSISLANGTVMPGMIANSYHLALELMYLPDILIRIQRLDRLPSAAEALATDIIDQLVSEITKTSNRLGVLEATTIRPLFTNGQIFEVKDARSPLGTSFHFHNYHMRSTLRNWRRPISNSQGSCSTFMGSKT